MIIFGGTTEGRKLSEYVCDKEIKAYVSVTSDYGASLLPDSDIITILNSRMDANMMRQFFTEKDISLVIDATHPYAIEVTNNIKQAIDKLDKDIKYIRVIREKSDNEEALIFDSLSDVIDYLKGSSGNIFVTTGSKELKEITKIENYENRCIIRILDVDEIVETSVRLGFKRENILAKRGPFSYEENMADFSMKKCDYLITKDGGDAGGYMDKIRAAKMLGIKTLVVKRPDEFGLTVSEVKRYLDDIYNRNRC